MGLRHDRQRREGGASRRDGSAKRIALGASPDWVGRIFDIAACVDGSVDCQQRSANTKLRVWRVGVLHRGVSRGA